jgi:tetratricopeptide (TPR) repeat protein
MSERTDSAFALAVDRLNAGRLDDAESLLVEILSTDHDHLDALQTLAGLRYRRGDASGAEELFRRAVGIAPRLGHLHASLGAVLTAQGRLEEAADSLRLAMSLDSGNPQILVHLAVVLNQQGQQEQAVDTYRKAIALQPDFPDAYNNLGTLLMRLGCHEESAAALRQAVAQRPEFVEAHNNLSAVLRLTGSFEQAAAEAGIALRLRSNFAEAHFNRGAALSMVKRYADAASSLRRALELRTDYAEAWFALATVLERLFEPEAALSAYERCVELDPSNMLARVECGTLLFQLGRFEEAVAAHRRTLELCPDCVGARYGLGIALLLKGNFAEGWPLFEARRQMECFGPRHPPLPRWNGEPLEGRRILLHCDQGLGDVIQFARYAKLVQDRGGRVVFRAYDPLRRLLAEQPWIEQCIGDADPLPQCDLEYPLLSLAYLTGTTLETIPHDIPYLSAIPTLVEQWQQRVAGAAPTGLQVGLVWAGNRTHRLDRLRSLSLAQLAPLANVKHVTFFSMQVGESAVQAKNPPSGMRLHDFSNQLTDLAETAALIENLDLVISVDTSVAHLAGALGKPVWLLLPFVPDWRWLLEGSDSPWYPTMRLFRQSCERDWINVTQNVQAELVSLVADRR